MEAVGNWREKSDIVLVDSDSGSVPEGSVLEGLAGKFEREGFSGHLWFVRGGHNAALAAGVEMMSDELSHSSEEAAALVSEDRELPASSPSGNLMAGRLSRLAFQQGKSYHMLNGLFLIFQDRLGAPNHPAHIPPQTSICLRRG
jgi:hypothetical protein